jgi:hypothetical protein
MFPRKGSVKFHRLQVESDCNALRTVQTQEKDVGREIAMGKTLKERLSKLPAGRRAKVEARAAELLPEG